MTPFDLLFILLLFGAIAGLIIAAASAVRGQRRRAMTIIRALAVCGAAYIAVVYLATALSKPVALRVGEPQCNDDWCLSVESVQRTPKDTFIDYEVTLRIFSRARRRPQRENIATDVYLVDSRWSRYDPILQGSEIPLNTLLQPGQSVTTQRHFELPRDAQEVALKVGHWTIIPFCLIIGECEAFRKGPIIRLD